MVQTLQQKNIIGPQDFEFPKGFKGWKSKQDFLSVAMTENGCMRGIYDGIHRTLVLIEAEYGCDPIQVIAYHYYSLKESSITLYSHSKLSRYFQDQYSNADHLNRCLSETFGWELRPAGEITEKGRKRLSAATSRQVAGAKEQTARDVAIIFDLILRQERQHNDGPLNDETLKPLKNNPHRIFAILAHELEVPSEKFVMRAISRGVKRFSVGKVAAGINLFLESKGYNITANRARVLDIGPVPGEK